MISRYRLLHPSRYIPILLATAAVVVLVPADAPTGDGTGPTATAGSALAVAASQPAAPEEPAVKIAEVSRRPPAQDVAAVSMKAPAPAPSAPVPKDTTLSQDLRSVDSTATATAPADAYEPPPAEPEAAPDEAAEEKASYQIARVGGSALNVRAGPSSSNQKLFVLRPGEPVRVAEMDGNWARIVRADGDEGWAFARYLTGLHGDAVIETEVAATPERTATPERAARADEGTKAASANRAPQKPAASNAEPARYARMGSDVAARSAPSAGAAQLFVLPAGSRVKISEIRGPWARVVTNSGVSGWVRYR